MVVKVQNILLSLFRAHIKRMVINSFAYLRCIELIYPCVVYVFDAPHEINYDRLPLVALIKPVNRFVIPLSKRVVFSKKLLHLSEPLNLLGPDPCVNRRCNANQNYHKFEPFHKISKFGVKESLDGA